MPNFQLPKFSYTTIGITLYKYDLDAEGNLVPDLTTTVTMGVIGSLTVEPIAGNRSWYVSVPAGATAGALNQSVVLSANIPADGNGAGAPAKSVTQGFTFDTIVPVDHRGSQPSGPTPVLPLPHP